MFGRQKKKDDLEWNQDEEEEWTLDPEEVRLAMGNRRPQTYQHPDPRIGRDRNRSSNKKKKLNREIRIVAVCFLLLFGSFLAYFIHFLYIGREEYVSSVYNTRQDLLADQILRGDIVSADGCVLAQTITGEDGTETRVYPYAEVFDHAVGYTVHGKSGIEADCNVILLSSHLSMREQILTELTGGKVKGDTVVTTLNAGLQQIAWDAMGDYSGAVIVLEPSTGKILAMVSKSGFDPNTLEEDWDTLAADEDGTSPLFNRALSGLYPPGSTFKIVTALAYYRQYGKSGVDDFLYECTGSFTDGEDQVRCFDGIAHGQESFAEAFAYSCNSAFCSIGLRLDLAQYRTTAEQLFFNDSFTFDLVSASGSFALSEDSENWEVMQTSIGQGETLVTPLQMALITEAIANGGTVMVPYMVDHVETAEGELVEQYSPEVYQTVMTEDETYLLTELMKGVVNAGTATVLQSDSYQAAVKTGTAEYVTGSESAHSWITGFAPADDPQILVTVVLENGGTGGGAAAQVAKQIFDAYLTDQ